MNPVFNEAINEIAAESYVEHIHAYKPCRMEALTSLQLRKLSLYRTGFPERCECGFMQLPDMLDPKTGYPVVYSRNGSRLVNSQ